MHIDQHVIIFHILSLLVRNLFWIARVNGWAKYLLPLPVAFVWAQKVNNLGVSNLSFVIFYILFWLVRINGCIRRGRQPLLRGPEWFFNVRAQPDFYTGAGKKILHRYWMRMFIPFAVDTPVAIAIFLSGRLDPHQSLVLRRSGGAAGAAFCSAGGGASGWPCSDFWQIFGKQLFEGECDRRQNSKYPHKYRGFMVGQGGLEPPTSPLSVLRSLLVS
jgi:hypothetical protein